MNKIGAAELKLLQVIYQDNIEEAYQKLKENYPIQYLIGYVDFYNTKIKVNENVLIPRYETEILVDEAIKFLKNKNYQTGIDLCTGSGAIAIALQKHLAIPIDACDISNDALSIAKENNLENKTNVYFFNIDILKDIPTKHYDFIISNPPYVKEIEYTSPETKYEPKLALYAKDNGLEFYKRILSTAKYYLNKNGTIIFEIGATLANDIKNIALTYFPNAKITIKKDFNNFDRFMFIET